MLVSKELEGHYVLDGMLRCSRSRLPLLERFLREPFILGGDLRPNQPACGVVQILSPANTDSTPVLVKVVKSLKVRLGLFQLLGLGEELAALLVAETRSSRDDGWIGAVRNRG